MMHIREVYHIQYKHEIDIQSRVLGDWTPLSILPGGALYIKKEYGLYERRYVDDGHEDHHTGWSFPSLEQAVAHLNKLQGLL